MGFIDTMRAEGHAVESVCRVLREQGCQVAARTYRAWRLGRVAARTMSDAQVVDASGWKLCTQSSADAASESSPMPWSNSPWLRPTPRKLNRITVNPMRWNA